MRWMLVFALGCVAAAVGYVAVRDPSPAPRHRSQNADVRALQERLFAVEEQVRRLETRIAAIGDRPSAAPEPPARPDGAKPGAKIGPYAKAGATEAEREEMRAKWRRRLLDATTDPARLAAVRDAHAQLKKHAGPETARRFFEDLVREVDPASAVGLYAQLQLGHYARHEKEYDRAEEHYRRVEGLATPGTSVQADAVFQLAWSRSFRGDPEGAEREFERAATVPGIDPGTHAAALYAIAHIRREAGDAAGAERRLREVVDLSAAHPGHGGVTYYVRLARDQLP